MGRTKEDKKEFNPLWLILAICLMILNLPGALVLTLVHKFFEFNLTVVTRWIVSIAISFAIFSVLYAVTKKIRHYSILSILILGMLIVVGAERISFLPFEMIIYFMPSEEDMKQIESVSTSLDISQIDKETLVRDVQEKLIEAQSLDINTLNSNQSTENLMQKNEALKLDESEELMDNNLSIDCDKETIYAKKLICTNWVFSQMDALLFQEYEKVMAISVDKQGLAYSQDQWLLKRDACPDTICVNREYAERLNYLRSF